MKSFFSRLDLRLNAGLRLSDCNEAKSNQESAFPVDLVPLVNVLRDAGYTVHFSNHHFLAPMERRMLEKNYLACTD